jgi:hypothetical protein
LGENINGEIEMTIRSLTGVALTIASLTWFVGCEPSAPATKTASSASSDHGHDHKEGDHAHSGHGAGPHDGTMADWGGGKYHVEFTVDHDKKEATVYLVGSDEKSASPIKATRPAGPTGKPPPVAIVVLEYAPGRTTDTPFTEKLILISSYPPNPNGSLF